MSDPRLITPEENDIQSKTMELINNPITSKIINKFHEEISTLKARLEECEGVVSHYAGEPFKTSDIYMNIFYLFKIENGSVTSFDSDKFKEHAQAYLDKYKVGSE